MVFFLWSGFGKKPRRQAPFASVRQGITQYSKGKGGVQRRKTVAFSSFGMGSERRDKKPQVFQLWSWFEGKGGTRRKTVAFSSLGWVLKERDKKPQDFQLWSWFQGKGDVQRRKTVAFSSFGLGSK